MSYHFEKSSKSRNLLIPKPLLPGDTVGVVAACGPPVPETLASGIAFLERKGFNVITGAHMAERDGYLAGTDEQRCEDLNSMLRNPEARAVFLARGGYGSMRILDGLDLDAIVSDPKLVVGMSDVTALQLSLYSRCGLVTLAGPMPAGQIGEGLDPESEVWLLRALESSLESFNFFPQDSSVHVLRRGVARGHLLGGCLSLITALTGTLHTPDFSGSILLIEDVGEAPYRLDRMLMQLKLAGILEKVSGLIIGHFLGLDGRNLAAEVEGLILEMTGANPIPIVSRFPHGHALPNLTLPHGAYVQIDTESQSMTLLV